MGTIGWIILVIVILVVVAGAAYALMGNKRTEAKRHEAEAIRAEASENAAAVEAQRRQAEEAAARAEVARAEAARAEQAAAEANQGVTVEEARVEDRLRTADHVDPDVDTRTDDYRPTEPRRRTPRPTGEDVTGPRRPATTFGETTGETNDPRPPARGHPRTAATPPDADVRQM